MTSAPIAQQRLLIDLQDLDSRLARLRHERKHLPVLTRIESVIERLKVNKRAAIQAEAALAEAKKQATRSENEVAQVVRRAEVLRERLHSGTSAARDLSAIQGEIDQLGQRQSALEEAQIVAMEPPARRRSASARRSQRSVRPGGSSPPSATPSSPDSMRRSSPWRTSGQTWPEPLRRPSWRTTRPCAPPPVGSAQWP